MSVAMTADDRARIEQIIRWHVACHVEEPGGPYLALCIANVEGAVERIVAERMADAKAEALRAFADSRGVNVGDEDDEWWRGYRQAQRECLHDAIKAAEATP